MPSTQRQGVASFSEKQERQYAFQFDFTYFQAIPFQLMNLLFSIHPSISWYFTSAKIRRLDCLFLKKTFAFQVTRPSFNLVIDTLDDLYLFSGSQLIYVLFFEWFERLYQH